MAQEIKTKQIAGLLLGTAGMLLLVILTAFRPAFGSVQENPKRVLSYYLIDTEFLAQCARRHPDAVEKTLLLSPELRAGLSRMFVSSECCE